MKIALMTDTFLPVVDGVGRVVHSYADGLCKRGHDCYVIAPINFDTGYRGGYPFELIEYVSRPLKNHPQYMAGVPILDRHYTGRINSIDVDIIHSHSPFMGSEALRIAKKKGIPLVSTFHSKFYEDIYRVTQSEALTKIGIKMIVDFYDKCDDVWTVSRSTCDVLRQYGYYGNIQVMPNGTNIVEPPEKGAALAEKAFFINEKENILLYVGQMDWKKNIDCILHAMKALCAMGGDIRLVLAGQGKDEEEITAKIRELGIENRVILAGHVKNPDLLNSLYMRAQLFVFPSLYDNAPMVVREAACMHTPSVLVKGSDAAEVIEDGVNGFLCQDNEESLANTIIAALKDKDRLSKAGDAAYETIPKSWDTILENAAERYRFLIENKKEKKRTARGRAPRRKQ